MQLFGYADDRETPGDGQYLKAMDFEAFDGMGHVRLTKNAADAMAFYRTAPKCHPIRLSDGKPNRPLAGFNWCFCDPAKAAASPQ